MDGSLVTPKGRTSKVWQHFGFPKGDKEGKKAVCKICKVGVVHARAGGTTNLKTHLYTWHRQLHDELFQESSEIAQTSTRQTQGTMDDFVRYTNPVTLPHASE